MPGTLVQDGTCSDGERKISEDDPLDDVEAKSRARLASADDVMDGNALLYPRFTGRSPKAD